MQSARAWVAGVVLCLLWQSSPVAESDSDPLARLQRSMTAAESSLRHNELQVAESRYRSALFDAWMLLGNLEAGAGRFPQARAAFEHASVSAVADREARQSLALVDLQLGEAESAVEILRRLVSRSLADIAHRRLLAQALVVAGRPEEAVQELEEAHGLAPGDPELQFLLASGYLRLKKVAPAERLFAQVVEAKPLPETWVLIGRTYRDFREWDRARHALQTALRMNPRVRRAHYYLGTIAVMVEGAVRLDEAIAEFEQELKLAPADPVTNLRLGIALVEARQTARALAALELAVRSDEAPPDAFYYLGRCHLALERSADAAAAFERALELAHDTPVGPGRLSRIHYQLAVALRTLGKPDEAASHFAEAERLSNERAEATTEALDRYLADSPEPDDDLMGRHLAEVWQPFAALSSEQRRAWEAGARAALVRSYFNLGIMLARKEHFSRAAELFERAAAIDPDFPKLQYSLGVAYFNAQDYAKAAPPLERALATEPDAANVRRMLAMAWLNAEGYEQAAEILRDDPGRDSDPSLQYAYALALVRSDQGAAGESVFAQLLAEHGDTPELNVLLGQAHAQQGDYESAIASLQRALARKADVADANATLGIIYLKQGRLPEAVKALRAEMTAHPSNVKVQLNLATVLDLQGQSKEAVRLLRSILASNPRLVDARYLLGKTLLAEGAIAEAVRHLEAAAGLAPDEANIHYQLGQAYQKQGRTDLAERQFELFQRLKDTQRTP